MDSTDGGHTWAFKVLLTSSYIKFVKYVTQLYDYQ